MSIIQDMMGGDWEREWRRLKVTAQEFTDGREISYRLSALEHSAKAVDKQLTGGGLMALDHAARKLETAVMIHAKAVAKLREEVGDLVAAVHQARVLHDAQPYEPEPDPYLHKDLDEDLIDRLGAFYGIPKPRHRR